MPKLLQGIGMDRTGAEESSLRQCLQSKRTLVFHTIRLHQSTQSVPFLVLGTPRRGYFVGHSPWERLLQAAGRLVAPWPLCSLLEGSPGAPAEPAISPPTQRAMLPSGSCPRGKKIQCVCGDITGSFCDRRGSITDEPFREPGIS